MAGADGISAALGRRARLLQAATLFIALFVIFSPLAALAQTFPALTGRVVDAANLLSSEQRLSLEEALRSHESETAHQIVVATVSSLEGLTVEDYANRLFRHWQLGQRDKNNGALLLVAPRDRKVRIEVGYGLEGQLTDALSKLIIETAIIPSFRQDDFAGGVQAGIAQILSILRGDTNQLSSLIDGATMPVTEGEAAPYIDGKVTFNHIFLTFVLIILIITAIAFFLDRSGLASKSGPSIGSSSTSRESSSSNSFSGRGGSSGGGGASGSW